MKLRRSKKGVGSIIGAVFVILIILSGFTFYEVALNNINGYTAVVNSMNQADWDKRNEDLSILAVQITSTNQLNITAQNLGTVQASIIWLGIFNQSMTPEGQWFYNIAQEIGVGRTQSFLSTFSVTPGQKYVIQLVTENGNVYDYSLSSANQASLELTLVAATPTVYQGNNLTMFLTVTNNNTFVVQDINLSLLALPSSLVTNLVSPNSLTIDSLGIGQSMFFTWIYEANNSGSVVFKATYSQAPQGALTTTIVTILTAPTVNQGQVTITGTSGNTIPYRTWQNYSITSTSGNGEPTPYVYISIYANGSNVVFKNAVNNETIANPAWVQLDSNGVYQLSIQASNSSQQTITLFVSVGTTLGKKSIVQEAPTT